MKNVLTTDLVCFCHLRWDFVFQRPQHLLTRYAKVRRVFVIEDPVFGDIKESYIKVQRREDKLVTVVPHLPHGLSHEQVIEVQRVLVDQLFNSETIKDYTLWYYTPMALAFTDHLKPSRTIYDCMDELSAFKGAPRELLDLEKKLFGIADHVFTGGHTLYKHKRSLHPSVHAFPSSIDYVHFSSAREKCTDPKDQKSIPHPRLGFYGVLDERFDIELIEKAAALRPDWHFVMIGPVVKVDPATLPQRKNIHYLGMKSYKELPTYLSNWDAAILPFAINEATYFISPTKTPEYLAAGKPVVSTPIKDVVEPYGNQKLVHIAADADEFVVAVELALMQTEDEEWAYRVDKFLAQNSWDKTWAQMASLESEISSKAVELEVDEWNVAPRWQVSGLRNRFAQAVR